MITFPKPNEKSPLDEAIDSLLNEMSALPSDSDEYAKMVDQLVKLHALKMNEKRKRINLDNLITVIGSFASVLAIVGHERAHVVTSKAMQLLGKAR